MTASAYALMDEHGIGIGEKQELISSVTIARALTELEKKKDGMDREEYASVQKGLAAMLEKVLEYEEKEEICGPNRKSYYKTDRDATAMCLKADYYSGLGSNMHAAYNVQALVIKGVVFAFHVSDSKTDYSQFVPVLEGFFGYYGEYPKRVCADAGYGTIGNYRFLKENGIENYVKYLSWEGNMSGKYPDCYTVNDDGTITCLSGMIGKKTKNSLVHVRDEKVSLYRHFQNFSSHDSAI